MIGKYNVPLNSFVDGKTINLDPIGQMGGSCVTKMLTSQLESLEIGYNSTRVTRIKWTTNDTTFVSSYKYPQQIKSFIFTNANPLIAAWGY